MFVNMRLSKEYVPGPGGWWYKCLSGGFAGKTCSCPGRCNQIDACPGCTLKRVPGGVDKTDTCPGVIFSRGRGVTLAIIVICRGVCLNNGIAQWLRNHKHCTYWKDNPPGTPAHIHMNKEKSLQHVHESFE